MDSALAAAPLLEQEARALLARLESVRPFALQETWVAAAAPSPAALSGIEDHLVAGRRAVRAETIAFIDWIIGAGTGASAAEQQRRFSVLRVRFQQALAQFDLFSEAITQRSEADNGVLLSGLDVAAAEALQLPGHLVAGPPVLCSLHGGIGGSIRRARTRLPGGGDNPVSLIRIPRERMVGYGIASSLVHEVGHQGAAMLGLVESLHAALRPGHRRAPRAWRLLDGWISEIVADFWSIAKIGIGATLGLVALVSLPRSFVFRPPDDDPHPMPWLRVLLSCAIGTHLYPDPQWARLVATWRSLYPLVGLRPEMAAVIAEVTATIPEFVSVLADHRPAQLGGRSLGAALRNPRVRRADLLARLSAWEAEPRRMVSDPPSLAFAVLGQARASGRLTPQHESSVLRTLITTWAVTSTLATARATSNDAAMFVGQPAIWTQPALHAPPPPASSRRKS